MKLRKLALAALLAGFALPAAAQSYSFGDLLTGGLQAPDTGDGPIWATLDIVNTSGNTYTFTLVAGDNFDDTFGTGAFIREAEFNVDGFQGATNSPTLIDSSGVSSITASNGSNAGSIAWAFGDIFGGGQDRLESGETVSWTQTFVSGLTLLTPAVALHVQGMSLFGGDSGKYVPTTPIPEPETYAMMLAGLGLLGFVARRRRQSLGNVVPA